MVLKNASLPSESQALQEVIASHTASNIQKKKTNRKRNLPEGPARYDINSPEWENILIDQANKKSAPTANRSAANKSAAAKKSTAAAKKSTSAAKKSIAAANKSTAAAKMSSLAAKKSKAAQKKLRL